MLLTQTAAGSEVEATVQDTVDTITGFNKFIQEKGPDLIAFGIRILMALLIFIICHKVINWIRKITRASMERANSDTGARQFVDSLLKYGLHILLFLAIINSLGVESASIGSWSCPAGKSFQSCRWDADFIFEAFCCRGLYYRRQPWQ